MGADSFVAFFGIKLALNPEDCGSPRLPDCGAVFHTATAGA